MTVKQNSVRKEDILISGRSFPSRENNYKGSKGVQHIGATTRPMWLEYKGKVVKDKDRADGRG